MKNFIAAFRCYKILKSEYSDYRFVWDFSGGSWSTYPVHRDLLNTKFFTFEIIKL